MGDFLLNGCAKTAQSLYDLAGLTKEEASFLVENKSVPCTLKHDIPLNYAVVTCLWEVCSSLSSVKTLLTAISVIDNGIVLPNINTLISQIKTQLFKVQHLNENDFNTAMLSLVPSLQKHCLNTGLGVHCDNLHINSSVLNGEQQDFVKLSDVTNGVILELFLYMKQSGSTYNDALGWLRNTTLYSLDGLTKSSIQKSWCRLKEKHSKLMKSSSRNPAAVTDFLNTKYDVPKVSPAVRKENSNQTKKLIKKNEKLQKDFQETLLSHQLRCECYETSLTETHTTISDLKAKVSELCDSEHLQTKYNSLKSQYENQSQNLRQTMNKLKQEKTSNYYRRLKTRENNLVDREKKCERKLSKVQKLKQKLIDKKATFSEWQKENDKQKTDFENKITTIKRQKKSMQTALNRKINQIERVEEQLGELKINNDNLVMENKELQACIDIQSESNIPTRINEQRNAPFTDDIIECTVRLQTDANVAAVNIASAINVVSETIFHKPIPKNDLPSKSTAAELVNFGEALAIKQLGELLLNTSQWNLFSDGTSGDGIKVLNAGATLADGFSRSFGIKKLPKEDADHTVKSIKYMLSTIADGCVALDVDPLKREQEVKTVLCKILENLNGVMSDRSSVNKCVNDSLEAWRKKVLTDFGLKEDAVRTLNKFYCCAHVLLGFSDQAEKAVKQLEQTTLRCIHGPLGREADPKYSKFSSNSESAVKRCLRLTCDSLGPRGDEKNGCRGDWLTFVDSSKIISFHDNRFNCLFEGSACAYFHKTSIIDLFESGFRDLNLKLQSVLLDVKSEVISSELRALGLVWYHITGPLWNLFSDTDNEHVHYMDLYQLFQPLRDCMEQWVGDPKPLLKSEFAVSACSLLQKYKLNCEDPVCKALLTPCSPQKEQITAITLKTICSGMLVTMENQLSDFLAGGKFSTAPTQQLKNNSEHTTLTNLHSEFHFGDYRSSVERKRHASTHHHSTMLMLKINKPFLWLRKQRLNQLERRKLFLELKRKQKLRKEIHKKDEKKYKESCKQIFEDAVKKKSEVKKKKVPTATLR